MKAMLGETCLGFFSLEELKHFFVLSVTYISINLLEHDGNLVYHSTNQYFSILGGYILFVVISLFLYTPLKEGEEASVGGWRK